MTLRLVFLASGNGSAMRAAHQAIAQQRLDAEIALLAASDRRAAALEFARAQNIPALIISDETALLDALHQAQPDLIILSGYLRKLPSHLIAACAAPIINIHPALLPRFGGKGMFGIHVHRAVIAAGEKISGATIHLVNEHYDQGKIIAQSRVDVNADDTPESLARRVQAAEAALIVSTLAAIADSGNPPQAYIAAIAPE